MKEKVSTAKKGGNKLCNLKARSLQMKVQLDNHKDMMDQIDSKDREIRKYQEKEKLNNSNKEQFECQEIKLSNRINRAKEEEKKFHKSANNLK